MAAFQQIILHSFVNPKKNMHNYHLNYSFPNYPAEAILIPMRRTKIFADTLRLRHFVFLCALQASIINFLIWRSHPGIDALLNNLTACACLLFLIVAAILGAWLGLTAYLRKKQLDEDCALLVFAPFLALWLWNVHENSLPVILPFIIALAGAFACCIVLGRPQQCIDTLKKYDALIAGACAVVLSALALAVVYRHYETFSLFNPEDAANYNQMFWNTIHGRPFQTSLYGSNFAGHNSPIYFLIVPFYFLAPHPLTPIVIKSLLLSLSALPLYHIAKAGPGRPPCCLLLCAFLLHPYFISQHFVPPHEICYAPFFLLSAYYFYYRRRFSVFTAFLLLALMTKEHVASAAVMLGILSLIQRRPLRWAAGPIALGIAWGAFSIILIRFFQNAYHFDAPWLFLSLREKVSLLAGGDIAGFIKSFSSSNIANPRTLLPLAGLFGPLAIAPAFFSPAIIIGLPEFFLNLVADRPDVLSAARHYNIIVSCFLFIATLEGARSLVRLSWFKKKKIPEEAAAALLSVVILVSTLLSAPGWIWLARVTDNAQETATLKEALRLLPPDASVCVPKKAVVHVSGRKDYFFAGQTRYIKNARRQAPDYIVAFRTQLKNSEEYTAAAAYRNIFEKENLLVLKKVPPVKR